MHLSVIIATWNRSTILQRTLRSLVDMRVPEGVTYELLVCDNNSTDDTKAVVEGFKDALPLTYLFEATQGKSHALNLAIRHATGAWLLFLDDDVQVDRQWLAAYIDGIAQHPEAACMGGAIHEWLDEPVSGWRAFLLREFPATFGLLLLDKDIPMTVDRVPHGANMAVRSDKIVPGSFDPKRGMTGGKRVSGEDVLLTQRLLKLGETGWLLAGAKVGHHLPKDRTGVRAFCGWHVGIGRDWLLYRERPSPGRFGVAWWAWQNMLRRTLRVALNWRPWPTRQYFTALAEAAQYWGYLRG
jgi:glycosyltransferase involved in cell wall biosynthesis